MIDFKLRSWQTTDLESLVQHADNFNISRYLTDRFPFPYSQESGQEFIAMAAQFPDTIYAIEIAGSAVGGIGLHPQVDISRRNAELGYWLSEQYWGNGIMTRAISRMVDHGFQILDIDRIFARPFGTNLASQHILEKNGFVLEARIEKAFIKNGELLDELIYAIRRNDQAASRSIS